MEISKLGTTNLAQLNSDASLVTLASTPLLPDLELRSLHVMMRQARALKPNQDIPEDTAVMYALEWAELVRMFDLETFRDALLKALRESAFFPDPSEIRAHCKVIGDRKYEEQQRMQRNAEREAKERHMREHPEEYLPTGGKA